MKNVKRYIAAAVVFLILTAASVIYLRPGYVVPILMYHSIGYDTDTSLHVSPDNFHKQVKYLVDKGYNVIPLEKLIKGIKNKKKFPHNTVVITFDDGYRNNFTEAFPILAKYKLPATIFIVSGYVGRKDYVTWEQVRLMADNGISFGGHTVNNVYLPSLDAEKEVFDEINGCRQAIRNNAGVDAMTFCYPTGGYDDRAKKAVKDSGYIGACTTNRGSDRFNRDIFALNRVKVTNSDMKKPFHFRAKLSGYYNLFRRLRSGS